ncbi:MAG: GntR family transcriptional regulator [Nocardioidaceae bacterium]|nr:GntR family transcriptional regulator [Nocardioidaceae bacterium]
MDLSVDPASPVPPFEQLRTQVAGRVASGDLPPGTRLPTVRALATQLGLAVNTVARVYRELEADGVVETRGRQGTFVRSAMLDAHRPDVDTAARSFVDTARRAGLTRSEATLLVERTWPPAG